MTEREYRQDDRTIGHCPVCGAICTAVGLGGRGYCPNHGWVWVDWTSHRKEPSDAPPASHRN